MTAGLERKATWAYDTLFTETAGRAVLLWKDAGGHEDSRLPETLRRAF